MKIKELSTIIPVYNEKLSVENTVNSIESQMKNIGLIYEILIIDDSSTDGSSEVLKKIINNNIRVLSHTKNKGYGASLKTGIKNASYDWILIIDADGTYPTQSIPDLLNSAPEYDMVVGSREKRENAIPFERKHAKKFLNFFASYLAGQKIPDLNSGLRIFKKDIVLKYWELFPDKFSFTSTLTMACLSHGYTTKFIPIEYYKRTGKSSIKPVDFFNFIKLITKLSLFFKPFKVFAPLSLFILLSSVLILGGFFLGLITKFPDASFIVLCALSVQTFFFGLLAEIIIHNKY